MLSVPQCMHSSRQGCTDIQTGADQEIDSHILHSPTQRILLNLVKVSNCNVQVSLHQDMLMHDGLGLPTRHKPCMDTLCHYEHSATHVML